MRCGCCNKRMTDYETTLKHGETGKYLDTCLDCLSEIARDVTMPVKARKDLVQDMAIHEDVDELSEDEYNRYSKDTYED